MRFSHSPEILLLHMRTIRAQSSCAYPWPTWLFSRGSSLHQILDGRKMVYIQEEVWIPLVRYQTLLSISLLIVFLHRLSQFTLSITRASPTDRGTSTPYLWVTHRTRELTPEMILSLRLNVKGTHQANAGSLSMPRDLEYSAASTGFEFLIILSGIHSWDPFLHWT